MKKILLAGALLIFTATAAFSQFNFRLTYGTLDSKMATFGYDFGNWTPYVGLDVYGIGAKVEMGQGGVSMEAKAGLNAISPIVGVRYYFLESDRLKGYGNLSFSKAFLGGKLEVPEALADAWGMGDEAIDYKLGDVMDKKSLLQVQLGFGAEYFFNDNLSLVAEYGFRYINLTLEPNMAELGAPSGMSVKASLSPYSTFAKIGLGFHF